MRLSWRVPFAVTVAIGTMASLNSLWSARSIKRLMSDRREMAVEGLAKQFRGTVLNFGNQAAAISTIFSEFPVAQEAFRSGDRKMLQDAVNNSFKAINEKFGISVLQFVGANAEVFYRAHNPDKYGDNASNRELVTSTLQRKISQSGIEAGSSGVAVRGILPIGPKGSEFGLVEAGMPFDKILNEVNEQTGFEIGIYLDAKLSGKLEGRLLGRLKEIATTNSMKMKAAIPDGGIDIVQEVIKTEEEVDGVAHGFVKMPLLDFANQNIGTIVGIRSFELEQKQEREAYLQLIIQAILMTVVGAGVINITFAGLVMRPIHSLTKGLNGQEDEIKYLTKRGDEIGEIARKVLKEVA